MGAQASWLNLQTSGSRVASPPGMAEAKAPTEADLQAKVGALKSATTKEGDAAAAPEVIALYKKAWADAGGDKDKIMAALKLTPDDVDDACFKDEAAFLSKTLGVKA